MTRTQVLGGTSMFTESVAEEKREAAFHKEKITLLFHHWCDSQDRYASARRHRNFAGMAIAREEMRMTDSIRETHVNRIEQLAV